MPPPKTTFSISILLFFWHTLAFGHADADTTAHVPSIRFEADVGAEVFGYQGALRAQYHTPSTFTLGARLGQEWGKWTGGFRVSQAVLMEDTFEGDFFFEGALRKVNVEASQRHTIFSFDVRRDFWSHRNAYPFMDAGFSATRMVTRLWISDSRVPVEDDEAFVDRRDLHMDNQWMLNLGAGVRIKLNRLFGMDKDGPANLKDYAFLEFRLGYAFGRDMTFVNGGADPNLPITPPRTSHPLYQRPILTSPSDAFFIRVTLGFRINA